MTRARSLSRLANSTVFTVSDTNRVGIGSTIPDVKLDVGGKAIIDDTTQTTSVSTGALVISGGVGIGKSLFVGGDMSVSGTLTYEDVTNTETAGVTTTGGLVVTGLGATFGSISTHFSNIEFGAAGVGGTITPLGHAEFAGVVTATSFSGDGSGLTGVASTDNIITGTAATFNNNVSIADSIFHVGDTNTAFGFPAADTFTVYTAGSERVRVDSSGRMGLGTLSPESFANLHIEETSGNAALLLEGSDRATIILADNNGGTGDKNLFIRNDEQNLLFGHFDDSFGSADEKMRLDSSGRLGIGIAAPTHSLHVYDDTDNSAQRNDVQAYTGGITIQNQAEVLDAFAALRFNFHGDDSFYLKARRIDNNNGEFEIGQNYSSTNTDSIAIKIDNTLNVGIGTTIPGTELHVQGNNGYAELRLSGNSGSGGTIEFYEATTKVADIFADPSNNIVFRNTTEKLRIGSSGQIGLGGANYGTAGQAIVSNGSGSAPTWQDVASGISTQAGTASGIVTSMFLTDATDHKVTATGICTITTTQAGTEGESHTIRIVNSGIATVGFSTYFLFPSGSAPVLPTADGAVSLISFTVHDSVGAGCTQLLAGASVNFS